MFSESNPAPGRIAMLLGKNLALHPTIHSEQLAA